MERVQVYVRVRPPNYAEKESGENKVVKCAEGKVTVNDKPYDVTGFGPDVDSQQFYKSTVQPIVLQGLSKGVNTGILCWGGSGRTTSLGSASGLVSLTADDVFKHTSNSPYFVGLSYLNIYRDKFTDLLNPSEKQLKVKTQPDLGVYVQGLSEIAVKSTTDLMRLFEQGNKIRKILELEMNIASAKSHTVLMIFTEYKQRDGSLVRCQIQFYNIAGIDSMKEEAVSTSMQALVALITELGSERQPSGYNNSKLTQVLKSVLDKSCYVGIIGHIAPTATGIDATTQTLDLLLKSSRIQLEPTPITFDTNKAIVNLRKRVGAARNAITAASTGNIPKEHIAELENSLAELGAAKRLQWDEREKASIVVEEERRHTLADQGILEWITETYSKDIDSGGKVLILQKEKDQHVNDYKKQRKTVDDLKTELQTSINQHTSLAETPNQSEATLHGSLTKIHKLRDQLKGGNERLRELKKLVKDVQDKLKLERSLGAQDDNEIQGNFELSYMIRKDEMSHLRRDNDQFLEEEKERLQSEAEQGLAEIKLSATEGNVLTLEQVMKLQEEVTMQTSQVAHLALHIQCLQAENEKLTETTEALRSAHKLETETHKMRNLLTFRQYKDFYEEAKTATNAKYQELLNSCVQDCIFLSSRNTELDEENTTLKRKLKHYS